MFTSTITSRTRPGGLPRVAQTEAFGYRSRVPTVVRDATLVVKVYGPPREHPPPHVHVQLVEAQEVDIRVAWERIHDP